MNIKAIVTKTDGRPIVMIDGMLLEESKALDMHDRGKGCGCRQCLNCAVESAIWLARAKSAAGSKGKS